LYYYERRSETDIVSDKRISLSSHTTSGSKMDKYEKLRQKHGAALLKVQANKEKIRQQGTVKSWMEVFVLLNDQNPNHVKPISRNVSMQEHTKKVEPRVAARLPDQRSVAQQQQAMRSPPVQVPTYSPAPKEEPRVKPLDGPRPKQFSPPRQESVLGPKTGLKAYDQLPTPQNPKKLLANDRLMYDQALEQQLKVEEEKLRGLLDSGTASPQQVQKQRDQLEQLVQQKELVVRQQKQLEETRARQIKAAKERHAKAGSPQINSDEPVQVAPAPLPLEGPRLEAALREFFREHEPDALEDGRLEAVLIWTEDRGVDKLCAMLREQYGKDLYGKQNNENTPIDQVQADRYARRLMGFYRAHNAKDMQKWEDCLKLGVWTCKNGEAALNAKLQAKYNDDLDSFGQRIMLAVEPKLRRFYAKINHEVLEKGLGPLLTWVVSNGVDALNEMLIERYGEDLDGKSGEREEKSEFRGISARAVLHREISKDRTFSARTAPTEDAVVLRKEILIKQLSSFLEVKDPKRLQQGGLVPLVQWAIPRTDRQVDDLLMESYGADLEETGLRRLSFDEDEMRSWKSAEDGPATHAAGEASNRMDDEFARAEIRSMRATTDDERVFSSPSVTTAPAAIDEFVDPDF